MTLKLTERDKKLLVVLVVVLLVAGLGGQVILPLMNKMSEIEAELTEEKIEKAEKEIKVAGLPGLEKAVDAVEEDLAEIRKEYKGMLLSKDVDELLTGMLLSHGVTVTGLSITMPEKGEQTLLAPYSGIEVKGESLQEDTSDVAEQVTYTGFSTAEAKLRVAGDRRALQALLDDLSARTPMIRVDEFQWENSDGRQALSVYLEIYMMKDVETYIEEQQEAN